MSAIDRLKSKMWGDDSFHLLRDVVLEQNRQIEGLKKKIQSLEALHFGEDEEDGPGDIGGDPEFYKM